MPERIRHCNTLQRTASHCNALQRTAKHCTERQCLKEYVIYYLTPYKRITQTASKNSQAATHAHTNTQTNTHAHIPVVRNLYQRSIFFLAKRIPEPHTLTEHTHTHIHISLEEIHFSFCVRECVCPCSYSTHAHANYVVATISRLLKITGLFCRI